MNMKNKNLLKSKILINRRFLVPRNVVSRIPLGKKYFVMLLVLLLVPLVIAQEGEEEAGIVGPENAFLHAFDRIGDNIAAFLSRIGGAETHANVVRRIVAERRAEHVRLLRLKSEGEITPQAFARKVSSLERQIGKKEAELSKAEQRVAEKASKKAQSGGKPESAGRPEDVGGRPEDAGPPEGVGGRPEDAGPSSGAGGFSD